MKEKGAPEIFEYLGLAENLHSGAKRENPGGSCLWLVFFHCLGGPVISYLITTKYVRIPVVPPL